MCLRTCYRCTAVKTHRVAGDRQHPSERTSSDRQATCRECTWARTGATSARLARLFALATAATRDATPFAAALASSRQPGLKVFGYSDGRTRSPSQIGKECLATTEQTPCSKWQDLRKILARRGNRN